MVRLSKLKTNQQVFAELMKRDPVFRWRWRLSWPKRKLSILWLRVSMIFHKEGK